MAVYLEPRNGGKHIVLDKAVILIGRQADCDVIITQSRKVSRKHCCIAQINNRYVIRDLASMNGVRVNGRRISRQAMIEVGDEVALGDMCYVVRDSQGEGQPNGAASEAKPASVPPALPPPVSGVPRKPPVNISQKFPVPIAEENIDFAVEPSLQLARPPQEGADRAAAAQTPPAPAHWEEDSQDIILLDDSGESGAAGSHR